MHPSSLSEIIYHITFPPKVNLAGSFHRGTCTQQSCCFHLLQAVWKFLQVSCFNFQDNQICAPNKKYIPSLKLSKYPLKTGLPKRKQSYSNHPFSGAKAVSFREGISSKDSFCPFWDCCMTSRWFKNCGSSNDQVKPISRAKWQCRPTWRVSHPKSTASNKFQISEGLDTAR